jgi:hypothetical protein
MWGGGGESSVSQSKEHMSESRTFGVVSRSATHSACILLCLNYALLRTLMFHACTYVPIACAVYNINDCIARNTPCLRATSPHVVGLLGCI